MSVAGTYAKALFQATGGQNADAIESELDRVASVLDTSKDARVALLGPLLNAKEKAAVIEQIAAKSQASVPTVQFLLLLARKGRLGLLPQIREAFHDIRLASQGGLSGRLVTAEAVTAEDVQSLARSFEKKLGKPVAFNVSIDPSLLAGMKVTVNGVTYDGTLRSQLQRLRDEVRYANPS